MYVPYHVTGCADTHKCNSASVALAGNMSVSSTFSTLPCPVLLHATWLVPSDLMPGKLASHTMLSAASMHEIAWHASQSCIGSVILALCLQRKCQLSIRWHLQQHDRIAGSVPAKVNGSMVRSGLLCWLQLTLPHTVR